MDHLHIKMFKIDGIDSIVLYVPNTIKKAAIG